MMWDFIERFTNENLVDEESVFQLGEEWYSVPKSLFKLGKDLPRHPVFVGTFLGRKKNNYIVPGVALLDLLAASKKTKKVFVADKAGWLFVCGKNVLHSSVQNVENAPQKGDWVLVMQSEDCLGFGEVETELSDAKGAIKNLFDIGDFLRRERKN